MTLSTRSWDIAKIRQFFQPNIAIQILQTPIAWNGGADVLWWQHSKSGDFFVKSSYFCIQKQKPIPIPCASTSQGIPTGLWHLIWKLQIPQKVKVFLWKLINNCLPVYSNLRKRRVM